jgi:hypothetical protein
LVRVTAKMGGVQAHLSDPVDLSLHAVRLLGFAGAGAIARRFGQDSAEVQDYLLDFEAFGWVTRSDFAGSGGWSLTDAGRRENLRRRAAELDATGSRPVMVDVHTRFVPLNARFLDAATCWQVRPLPGQPMASNDHTDHRWDDRVLEALGSVGGELAPLADELASELARLGGYAQRYQDAFQRASRGERRWVDGLGIDSCHTVWMQLHEDLLATLGVERSGVN